MADFRSFKKKHFKGGNMKETKSKENLGAMDCEHFNGKGLTVEDATWAFSCYCQRKYGESRHCYCSLCSLQCFTPYRREKEK